MSGCGGMLEDSREHAKDVPDGSLKFYWADRFHLGGFSLARVTQHNMTVTYIDAFGKTLYERALFPRSTSFLV